MDASPDAIALDWSRIDERIDAEMAADRVPGLSLAIVQDGGVRYAGGFGVASVEEGSDVVADTVFRIGSITKPLTAATLIRLATNGVLDLDIPVGRYARDLRLPDEAENRITLRALLSHGAGLSNDVIVDGARDAGGLEAFVRHDLVSLVGQPTTYSSYSNPGYAFAGFVAQEATGRPFADLVRENVTEPLAMTRTTLDPMVAMTYPLAQSHVLVDGEVHVQHRFAVNTAYAPAGLAFSTVLDLATFAVALLGASIVPADAVREMWTVHTRHSDGRDAGFGLGFEVYTARNGRDTVVHSGNVGGFWGVLVIVPSRRAAIAMLCNRTPGFRLPSLPYRLLDELLGLPSPWPAQWTTA